MGGTWVRGGGGGGGSSELPQTIRDGEGGGGVEGCTLFALCCSGSGPRILHVIHLHINITTFLQKRLFQRNMIIRANPVITSAIDGYIDHICPADKKVTTAEIK